MPEHALACEEWQPALAGWLMAQLPPDEEAGLAAHLAACTACRAEADSLLHVTADFQASGHPGSVADPGRG